MEPREKVLHSGATATGNGEILELNSEFGGLSVQISGITSATITFEGTVDGNWVEQRAVNKTTGAVATTATADGIYLFDVVGIRKFRARISAYVSGTIKVTANAVLVVPHIPELNVAGAIPAGTNVVGKVGIDQTANGVQLTDGTNTAAILANGKVPVDLGDTTLAANVAIQDGTDPAKKVTVQNGAILTQLSGSITSIASAPVVGSKTVTATAAELFAGASVKANRRKLIIRNEDPVLRLRIGPSGVTQQNGYPIEPGGTLEIQFDPGTAVAVYGISEGVALNVSVMEV